MEQPAPPEVVNHPGMTSQEEKTALYNLAKHYYRGKGSIVDVGIFLGASTNAFATGLRENTDTVGAAKPVQSYDTAIWVKAFERHYRRPATAAAVGEIKPGDSFLPALKRLLAPHLDLIEFHIGDIVQTAQPSPRPIEIAFYDCLKNKKRDRAVFSAFAPSYMPGHTLVIQQDYFFWGAYDNKIFQEYLSPYFEFVAAVRSSAVFRLIKALPDEVLLHDPTANLTLTEKVDLLHQAAQRAGSDEYRAYTELSIASLLYDAKETSMALECVDKIQAAYGPIATEGRRLRSEIDKARARFGSSTR
jgi:hypothetical protein